MSGTKIGGEKARETNKQLYGEDYYRKIGAIGGKATMAEGAKPKGFAARPDLASIAGAIGGKISKRRKK